MVEIPRWQSHYRRVDQSLHPDTIFTSKVNETLIQVQMTLSDSLDVLNRGIQRVKCHIEMGDEDVIDIMTQLVRAKQRGLELSHLVTGIIRLQEQTLHHSGYCR